MSNLLPDISQPPHIIDRADALNLNIRILYEAVIDLSAQGLITAHCINMAAGILLNDLGLPSYFFENITKDSLKQILSSITSSIAVQNDRVVLVGRVAHIDFDLGQGSEVQRVRIATQETRDAMEKLMETMISGHRREYYYSRENEYYTYIFRPETVNDFTKHEFKQSPFLFNLAGDYTATPEPTRMRYEKFLRDCKASVTPLVEAFNLPATAETRLMFNSDFATPKIPIFRQLLQDHGFTLMRAYWEPYWDDTNVPTSICSLYIQGELSRTREIELIRDIQDFMAFNVGPVTDLYVESKLTYKEMLFAGNAIDFARIFIFSESKAQSDDAIMSRLDDKACEEAFADRIHKAARAEFDNPTIAAAATAHPGLLKALYELFAHRFDPALAPLWSTANLTEQLEIFHRMCRKHLTEHPTALQVFRFMARLVTHCQKTNFYTPGKRAYSFRLSSGILDPLVYNQPVYGIFFINGHYAAGVHMRSADIARGGLRLATEDSAVHERQMENAALLSFILGPRDRRLKHKDICEDGAAGVIVPHPVYGEYPRDAVLDFTESILDLTLPNENVMDYYGRLEILFFEPDRGTAGFMDTVAFRAKERGCPHWRTIATEKGCGIPHDNYGLLKSGKLFGLLPAGNGRSDLQINGKSQLVTQDIEELREKISGNIQTLGMTATAMMAAFRTLIHHYNAREKNLNLMVIGGPDGRLGGNELLCCQGRICLAIDNEGLLFDPAGLDPAELEKLVFAARIGTAAGTLAFPSDMLSTEGFKVPATATRIFLPDGTVVEDSALFHREFLFNPEMRTHIRRGGIRACMPCGGFKEGVTGRTVRSFLENFKELEFIVEGAGLFFDNDARRYIATNTCIRHLKDTTANKGGVFSSVMAEVLPGFLLGDQYEAAILGDSKVCGDLVREILGLVETHAATETKILIRRCKADPNIPLFAQSDKAGEEILALQKTFRTRLNTILKQKSQVWRILATYIPETLVKLMGKKRIIDFLNTDSMQEYRDAIITKQLAVTAFYRFGLEWDNFKAELEKDFTGTVADLAAPPHPPRQKASL
ncbi:NADP-specific glutamate dehydrogenase GdhA [Desulfobacter hydrogenophilus]|uniref:NADP-specific glutamate dehydrogenase GdhA n=1 Tax=Desulfobacter hydrogenophilus TaxID=2291 RepID=A0A328FB03_9BACT|nr:NAD-glutamate dehydrogenase domain-containing protein [Desulfobacter hydrogenophilus]NDY72946.1 NADP-specific glutamate dehydrogenase GdhA [Desulfobacter hydrogenophilus]QBH12448.1 NADP-specific glutamate dehydrogenase GdhA [Desulfobacter hydrogenophilus]RAM01479.1 NADP-specific glutamate dehydrogenase GdhA [Desulfobacter hydrogenophilus]